MRRPVRKKLVSIVLSMIVLVSIFFSWSVTSWAAEETSPTAAPISELKKQPLQAFRSLTWKVLLTIT